MRGHLRLTMKHSKEYVMLWAYYFFQPRELTGQLAPMYVSIETFY